MTYLGKVVGLGEVCPVRASNHLKELVHFLGMVGYYVKFCGNFSSVVAPLINLLKVKFEWSPLFH